MDLGVVLAGFAEDVDDLAARILGVVGPFGDPYHGLVAVLTTFEFVLWDEYVEPEEFGVGFQEGDCLVDLKGADERLLLALDDLHNLGFGFLAGTCGGHVDAHPIAVEGVHGIAFGHEDRFVVLVGDHGVLAVVAPDESAHRHVGALRRFERSGSHFDDLAVESHLGQHQGF